MRNQALKLEPGNIGLVSSPTLKAKLCVHLPLSKAQDVEEQKTFFAAKPAHNQNSQKAVSTAQTELKLACVRSWPSTGLFVRRLASNFLTSLGIRFLCRPPQ
jgi:hypothetical protein